MQPDDPRLVPVMTHLTALRSVHGTAAKAKSLVLRYAAHLSSFKRKPKKSISVARVRSCAVLVRSRGDLRPIVVLLSARSGCHERTHARRGEANRSHGMGGCLLGDCARPLTDKSRFSSQGGIPRRTGPHLTHQVLQEVGLKRSELRWVDVTLSAGAEAQPRHPVCPFAVSPFD
ncbi:hypothetical protein BJV78DRAFT_508138 [Lactifluus subvellereus]|nr:hypothetical protein BJV78DRAFT_155425 [Lactifluus subvellereus]KAI0251093.1 hypothetical protein BJV78DRAFT_508138 [Lactifluus subvellereus]